MELSMPQPTAVPHEGFDTMVATLPTTDILIAFCWMKTFVSLFKITLKFVHRGPIDRNVSLVPVMTVCRTGDNPLYEPIITKVSACHMGTPYHSEFKCHFIPHDLPHHLTSRLMMSWLSSCTILVWLSFQLFNLHMVCNSMPCAVCCVPDPQVMSSLGTWAGLPPQRLPSRAGQALNTFRPRQKGRHFADDQIHF